MNYKERVETSTVWRRAKQVLITNQLGATPTISFVEEDISKKGETSHQSLGQVSVVSASFNPSDSIPLIDPLTGASLGTAATHQELYVILHSLYIQQAIKRDTADTAAP